LSFLQPLALDERRGGVGRRASLPRVSFSLLYPSLLALHPGTLLAVELLGLCRHLPARSCEEPTIAPAVSLPAVSLPFPPSCPSLRLVLFPHRIVSREHGGNLLFVHPSPFLALNFYLLRVSLCHFCLLTPKRWFCIRFPSFFPSSYPPFESPQSVGP